MKNIYQKPNFRFVSLDITTTTASSSCYYTASYGWETCGIEVIPGFATVFTEKVAACDFGPDDGFVVCQHTGPGNSTVFGS